MNCRLCPRLADFLDEVKADHPDYFCRPVPPFGDLDARLLVVGLAPGKHGANASGRPFTGDHAGLLLYRMLHQFGFANRAESTGSGDGLILHDCRISNAVKCLPPENKPVAAEINQCRPYLKTEIDSLKPGAAILALGSIAHGAVIKSLDVKKSDAPFGHARQWDVGNDLTIFSSYHCSRYNTQTKRLTEAMFEDVFRSVRKHLSN